MAQSYFPSMFGQKGRARALSYPLHSKRWRANISPYPNRQAIGISANWLWSFFVAMISPTLIRELAWKGYLIFTCFNLIFVPVSRSGNIPRPACLLTGPLRFRFCISTILRRRTSVSRRLIPYSRITGARRSLRMIRDLPGWRSKP